MHGSTGGGWKRAEPHRASPRPNQPPRRPSARFSSTQPIYLAVWLTTRSEGSPLLSSTTTSDPLSRSSHRNLDAQSAWRAGARFVRMDHSIDGVGDPNQSAPSSLRETLPDTPQDRTP